MVRSAFPSRSCYFQVGFVLITRGEVNVARMHGSPQSTEEAKVIGGEE